METQIEYGRYRREFPTKALEVDELDLANRPRPTIQFLQEEDKIKMQINGEEFLVQTQFYRMKGGNI
jgi:hypothetical protein